MAGMVERVRSVLRRKPRTDHQEHYSYPVHDRPGQPAFEGLPLQDPRHQPQHSTAPTPHSHPPHVPNHEPEHRPRHRPPHEPHRPRQQNPPHGLDGGQPPVTTTPATVSGQLTIALQNQSSSHTVYAYITGQALNNNNALILISADGRTPYYPHSPSSTGTPLGQNISIPLGPPGSTIYATIPLIAGGRIWFSIGAPLVFSLNPGPALVEPSVFNPSDANINTRFGFCEFTFNTTQLFANITYVDFVGVPIALTGHDTSGAVQHVSGIPEDGMQTIARGLRAQAAKDGRRWNSLIVKDKSGHLLRIFSPNSGILLNPRWFEDYWDNYVHQVYARYASSPLTIDTQASYGDVRGTTGGSNTLNLGAGGSFIMPTAADIFSNSTGPFATGANPETNAIIPRLAAAFNRSTLLLSDNQPDGVTPANYYTNPTTNHYARIVHAANLDGCGYAFPYDDVTPDGGVPQEGAVFSYAPALLTVAVGGKNAYA